MKSLAIKGAVGLVGIGGIGVGGYYGIQSLNSAKEIKATSKDKLIKDKYTPIAKGNKKIATILEKYKLATESRFASFDGNKVGEESAEDILLRNCNSIFEKENATKEEYSKAKRWCVEPITVKDLLKNRQFEALITDSSNNDDDAKWKIKINAYRTNKNPEIKELSLSTTTDPTAEDIKNIKDKCAEASKKESYEKEFEDNLKIFEKWCANKQ